MVCRTICSVSESPDRVERKSVVEERSWRKAVRGFEVGVGMRRVREVRVEMSGSIASASGGWESGENRG